MSEVLQFGLRAAVSDGLKANVRAFMQQVLTDEAMHAEIVGAGQYRFREVFTRMMGAFFAKNRAGCDELANTVFRFCEEMWRERHPNVAANQWLDGYAPPSPLTEKEIDDAWEIEIASSDDAMSKMYEGSARTRKGGDLGSRRKT